MAATIAIGRRTVPRGSRVHYGTIQGDSSYTTGGLAVTPNQFGMDKLDSLSFTGGPLSWSYNATTGKVLVYWVDTTVDGAPMSEVANGTNLLLSLAQWTAVGT